MDKNYHLKEVSVANITVYVLGTLTFAYFLHISFHFLKLLYQRRRDQVTLKHFSGPKPHWLYGTLFRKPLGKEYLNGLEDNAKFGPAFVTHNSFLFRTIFLIAPEYVKCVMNTSEPKSKAYSFLKPWIGDGLLVSKGKKWGRNRRLLTPAFHFNILKPYQFIFSRSVNIMINKWLDVLNNDSNASIEIFDSVSLMTLDSLIKCIFGLEGDYQQDGMNNPYIKAVYELSEFVLKRIYNPLHFNNILYYFSYNGYRFRKACNITKNFSKNVIDMKRIKKKEKQDVGETNHKYVDFLDMLLDCRDSNGNGLSDKEIQDEVDTFMFEGHDTTASGIAWCLYNLALHKEYQEKCRQEVQSVIGNKNEVEWEDLSKMSFLTMCIKESLRICPPVGIIGRTTTKEHILPDGRVIPKGMWTVFNIYASHHNPEVWPKPDVYDPYRFTFEEINKRHPHAFIPFSSGPRNCIGQNFAMNEMKTVIALILSKLDLSIDDKKPIDQYIALVLRAKSGLWLKVKHI